MSITCEDLMGLKHFQSIKLLAGHSGIHRTVTWPYVVITPSESLRTFCGIESRSETLPTSTIPEIRLLLQSMMILLRNSQLDIFCSLEFMINNISPLLSHSSTDGVITT